MSHWTCEQPYCSLELDHDGPCGSAHSERRYTRAEVEALLAAQREAIASRIEDADDGVPLQCLADAVRTTPLVEITTNKDKP